MQVMRELQREQEAEEHCKLQELERLHLGAGCPVPRSKRVQTCTNAH